MEAEDHLQPDAEPATSPEPDDETTELDLEYESAIARREASFQQWADAYFYSQKLLNPEPSRARYRRYKDRLFEAFQASEGPILNSYYCSWVPSAAALTRVTRSERGWFGRRRVEQLKLHVLANIPEGGADEPEVAAALDLLVACDAVAVRIDEHLTGRARRQSIEMTYDLVTDVLALMDEAGKRVREASDGHQQAARGDPSAGPAAGGSIVAPAAIDGAASSVVAPQPSPAPFSSPLLEDARSRLRSTADYVDRAAAQAAQYAFLRGVAWALVGIAGLAWLLFGLFSAIPNRSYLAASFLAGSIGAVASVLSRMRTTGLKLDDEVGAASLAGLGAIRPVLGALSGLLLYFGVRAGIIPLSLPTDSQAQFALFMVTAFFAGFNERWAEDMLTNVGSRLEQTA